MLHPTLSGCLLLKVSVMYTLCFVSGGDLPDILALIPEALVSTYLQEVGSDRHPVEVTVIQDEVPDNLPRQIADDLWIIGGWQFVADLVSPPTWRKA